MIQFTSSDPEHFETLMEPMVGQTHVRPARTAAFNARVRAKPRQQLALFTVQAGSFNVHINPPIPFSGLNVALGKSFTITEHGRKQRFLGDIHVSRPDRELILEAQSDCRVLAACFYQEYLQDYILKLSAGNSPSGSEEKIRISNSDPANRSLVQSLANLWSVTEPEGPDSNIGVRELEDELIANFVMATVVTGKPGRRHDDTASARVIDRAEAYLCAHLDSVVSRANLAAEAGVSISTLSRGFAKRHGTGPMGFLKTRRLNAAYLELLGAEPGSTTVTEAATRYGFNHLGKFSVEYKQAFRESPSSTLHH